MKQFLIFLFLTTILAACAPAQAMPTQTSFPPADAPTVTVTLAPTSTSTPEPTVTKTEIPAATATQTESPTATAAPAEKGPPPKGFADWAEARKYGWVENAAGKSEQHKVVDKDGNTLLGDLLIEPVEIKYVDGQLNYQFPKKDGVNLFPDLSFTSLTTPLPTAHFLVMSFLVKNATVLRDTPFAGSGKDVTKFEVDTSVGPMIWDADDKEPATEFGLSTSTEGVDPNTGGIVITMLTLKEWIPGEPLVIEKVKVSRPGYPPMVIFEVDKK